MTRNLNDRYFEWMKDSIEYSKNSRGRSYKKLFNYLHSIDFYYILELDENRAEDGIDLRYHFGYEKDIDPRLISCELDVRPCSVLEMLIALAKRCEESIMNNSELGDRTGKWFWDMIDNLGLIDMDDSRYDESYVQQVVFDFLDRKYEPDGTGGLFKNTSGNVDMRNIEIWYQLMWHLNDLLHE